MVVEVETDFNLLYLEHILFILNSLEFEKDILIKLNELQELVDKKFNFNFPIENYDIKDIKVRQVFYLENWKNILTTQCNDDTMILSFKTMELKINKERQLSKMTDNKKRIELKRINMNLPVDLVQRVVAYGESKGLNTTSAYIVLLNQALDQKETIDNLPFILEFLKTGMAMSETQHQKKND